MPDSRRQAVVDTLERHQVPLYLAALFVGAIVGLAAPGSAPAMADAINLALALLLYTTFLGVPFASITRSLRDGRFLGGVLVLNFVLVPFVVFGLTRFIASDDALLVGALLVLLCPCIDYVMVFTRIAGGAHERLLAAAPLLMLLQMVLLPGYLLLFVGSDLGDIIEIDPFVEALVVLIIIPLAAAALTQAIARTTLGRAIIVAAQSAMVPLMMIVLAVVVGSQIFDVKSELSSLLGVAAVYVAFLVVMAAVGIGVSRLLGLDTPGSRALTFSGATRNSLVVLPLALALPDPYALAAVAVVTQTLVELVGMVTYVRLIPRLLPSPTSPTTTFDAVAASDRGSR
jgi:ACR3 family arsenite efflux pump ArsB